VKPSLRNKVVLMKISKQEVIHVAQLARLNIDESAIERFAGQLGGILAYMETLNRLDTSGVPPTAHVLDLFNVFREDAPATHLETEKALSNATCAEHGQFIVPRVID
jgi:aspartyl-tRNA(Asn)/glutamyl-tRNA(Gln) amidotransferase subunit C